MRVLWHSAAPWIPSGYGTQTAIWTRWLRDHGHDVAVSAYYGSPGHSTEWDGIPVFASPMEAGPDALLTWHADRWKADVIVTLCDVWLIDPKTLAGPRPVLAWTPIDTTPMSLGDARFHLTGPDNIRAVAMSEHGLEQLTAAGARVAAYIPHGIDTDLYRVIPERAELRAAYGLAPATYAVGMVFNNIDPWRKNTPNQMRAFAEFHRARPDSVLYVHSMSQVKGSLDLATIAATLKISDVVRFADQHRMRAGDYSDVDMVRWYNAMDVVLNATCGEGFGIPAVEAQACGTPVVLAANTTGRQLCGPGSERAACEPWWNPTHGAWWGLSSADDVLLALRSVARRANDAGARARRHQWAVQYDYRAVGTMWDALLVEL